MTSLRRTLLVLFAILVHVSDAAAPASKPGLQTTSLLTCPFRTVNYITHGLPQQCLASGRVATHGSGSGSAQVSNLTSTAVRSGSTGTSMIVEPSPLFASEQSDAPLSSVWPLPGILNVDQQTQTTTIQEIQSQASAPISASPAVTSATVDESDADSLLGNANFLSFEDWKKQNLVKAGQSEHIGSGRRVEHRDSGKRASPALQQGLDALGDDAEIDLDFMGFVADRPDLAPPKRAAPSPPEANGLESEQEPAIPKKPRSKDAGTTCKERYNYASFDCAATVLKTNTKAKGEKFVLLENKDSYMLNECSAENKFLILELCTDISIDTIVVANFEFFSSIFRTFRVSVSDKYPVKSEKWITLGTFEARNSREIQAFLIENPMIWARYVRFEFLTHYGNEFYCPLSLVRVHGTTMMEEYKHDVASAMLEEDGDSDAEEDVESLNPEETLVPDAVAQVLVDEKSRLEKAERAVPISVSSEEVETPTTSNHSKPQQETEMTVASDDNTTSPKRHPRDIFLAFDEVCLIDDTRYDDAGQPSAANASIPLASVRRTSSRQRPSSTLTGSTEVISAASPSTRAANITESNKRPSSSEALVDATTARQASITHVPGKGSNATTAERTKASSSATQAPPATPTIQESFFKSVQKRLQMLESNSSLSLQYIEEQSRALRDAFGRVEQKQLSRTTKFLDYLNTTVLNELRDFRQQYDQLWQSTVIELETQREQYQQETLAINSRFAIVADELIFQKRMAILQMVLILVCLGLVLFSRGPMNNYLDMPIVQSMLARSPSNRWPVSGLQTPSTSPPQTRPNSSHNVKPANGVLKRHDRDRSDASMNSVAHHTDDFSPLTPISNDSHFAVEGDIEPSHHPEGLTYDPSEIERPSTSPPVLPGGEGNASLEIAALQDETIDSRILSASKTDLTGRNAGLPDLILRSAAPAGKHLTFELPER